MHFLTQCLIQSIQREMRSKGENKKKSMYKASRREISPSCLNLLSFISSTFCMTTLVQTIPSCEILIVLCVTLKSRACISALYQICKIREFEPNSPKPLQLPNGIFTAITWPTKRSLSTKSVLKVMRSSSCIVVERKVVKTSISCSIIQR